MLFRQSEFDFLGLKAVFGSVFSGSTPVRSDGAGKQPPRAKPNPMETCSSPNSSVVVP